MTRENIQPKAAISFVSVAGSYRDATFVLNDITYGSTLNDEKRYCNIYYAVVIFSLCELPQMKYYRGGRQ